MRFSSRKLPVEVIKNDRWTLWIIIPLIVTLVVGAVLVVKESRVFLAGIAFACLISGTGIWVLISAYRSKLVLDDDGIRAKGIFFSRLIPWDQILGCRVDRRSKPTGHGAGRVTYFVVVLDLKTGLPFDLSSSNEEYARRLMNQVYERLQIGWREGKKCSRCMQDLREADAGATTCPKCSEDLTRDEIKWIKEHHRRKEANPQA